MKNLFKISVLIFVAIPALAQKDQLRQSPKGIFIMAGSEAPYDFTYQLSRKDARERSFTPVARGKIPAGKEEYRSRIRHFQKIFPRLPSPNENQIDRIWTLIDAKKNQESLFILHPVIERLSLGLALLDSNAVKGKKYSYRMEKIRDNEVIASINLGEIVFDPPGEVPLPQARFHKHKFINDKLSLQWIFLEKGALGGFEIYRRDNLKGDFHPVKIPIGYAHNLDTTFVFVNDTVAKRYEVYEYRLRPYDLLGNPGAFTPIAKVNTFTAADFPFLRKFKAVALANREIKLSWTIDFKPFIRNIQVTRSLSFDSGFVAIAEVSPRDSTYTDVLPRSMENYYYRLMIHGPDGIALPTSSTFVLYESNLRPEAPQNVAIRAVEGGAKLSWEDLQRNVFGYYIFRREKNEGFIQISEPVIVNPKGQYHYVDTTLSLRGDRMYDYAVKTISDSYVLSQFSDTVTVRPDIEVPIGAPRNFRGREADDKVYLFWDDLVDRNLMGYKVFRKKTFETEFNMLHDSLLTAGTNHFTDSSMEKGYAYDYAVKAYSFFGSESNFSNALQFKFYLNLPTPPPGVKAHKVREGIRIVWGDVLTDDLESFNLYRYSTGSKPTRITTVSANRHDFLDPDVEHGQLYFYYVTSSNKQEIEGRPSEAVSVRY